MTKKHPVNEKSKQEQLEQFKTDDRNQALTTNQGLKLSEDEFSLKAGERGPTLMEDFHFREKMTHFDHERIPERIVHARGFAAHGEFELYDSLSEYTKAKFLQN
ncbi:MAG: catalase, partial [Priestia megaterium]